MLIFAFSWTKYWSETERWILIIFSWIRTKTTMNKPRRWRHLDASLTECPPLSSLYSTSFRRLYHAPELWYFFVVLGNFCTIFLHYVCLLILRLDMIMKDVPSQLKAWKQWPKTGSKRTYWYLGEQPFFWRIFFVSPVSASLALFYFDRRRYATDGPDHFLASICSVFVMSCCICLFLSFTKHF